MSDNIATSLTNAVMHALHSLPEGVGCFDEETAMDFAMTVHGLAQEALSASEAAQAEELKRLREALQGILGSIIIPGEDSFRRVSISMKVETLEAARAALAPESVKP
jgi:hypothetical protein